MRNSTTCTLPVAVRALGALGFGVAVAVVSIGVFAGSDPRAGESVMALVGEALQAASPAGLWFAEIVGSQTYDFDRKSFRVAGPVATDRQPDAARAKATPKIRVELKCWQVGATGSTATCPIKPVAAD